MVKIWRWKHKNKIIHLLDWLQGFAEILDGLITVSSLGFFASNFEITIAGYRAKISILQLKNERTHT